MSERIGLIAGNGQFPILFAQSAKAQGKEIVAIAVRQETSPELENYVDKIYWLGLGEFRQFLKILKDEHLKNVVMAGQIRPLHIFNKDIAMDEQLATLLRRVKDKRANSLLGEIAQVLCRMGIRLLDSSAFLKDYFVPRRVLTKIAPSKPQWQDIHFGKGIAKRIADLDIGQTVVVKDKAILAIEAIEGTDEVIKRGGTLANVGAVVVKVSRRRQDLRFDIPIVGMKTLESLVCASCAVLAMEAKRVLLFDKEQCIKSAEEHNICLVGI